jgi:glycosyltransferase involved in cell wall biosynthesis
MKILMMTRYGPAGASSRVRFYQFLPDLETRGFEIEIAPLFPDTYVDDLYRSQPRPLFRVIKWYFERSARLTAFSRYDLVWLQGEIFPFLPAWTEEWLGRQLPYVVDYDDAIFHRYDLNRWGPVRLFLGEKIDRVMRSATLVTVGNAYLGNRARMAGARCVVEIPSTVDIDRYRPDREFGTNSFTIGWIGSPITEHYLRLVEGPLRVMSQEAGVRITLIGASKNPFDAIPVDVRPWSTDTEVAELRQIDVGIMPLPDAPWERGKCGYKLIQYMACAKPVVASPVGANREIVQDGRSGFLAHDSFGWIESLRRLRRDLQLRRYMGAEGRRRVEMNYSRQGLAPRLADLLESSARRASVN